LGYWGLGPLPNPQSPYNKTYYLNIYRKKHFYENI